MSCRQTSCRHCGQDIENTFPFRNGEWRDRGNNSTCPNAAGDAGQVHAPYVEGPARIRVHVTINYRTHRGNCASTARWVNAVDLSAALRDETERVRKFKRCARIDGGSAVPMRKDAQ